ncbi:MAG TPA: GNAT family N-acetyltransferase [Phaeodactylibacter sp.]|nr:GNAT family N-acetyltransferase [Phaeodactylibacter sp.]
MTKKETYLAFCEKEKEIPIFSQSWYLDAVCGASNWDILIVEKGDEIAATMPVFTKKRYGFTFLQMQHLTKYWGAYFPKKFCSPKKQQKLMRALISELPPFDFFEIAFSPSLTDWLPFFWEKFEATVGYTFVINLEEDLEKIYQKISANYRNNKIQKARKIVQIISHDNLQEFYTLQRKTFDRQKVKIPFSFDFLEKYDESLKANNARKMFFAVDDKNQIHSAVYLIWDEFTAYLLMAGDDPNLRSSGAGILLIWHAIEYAKKELQKKKFDFLGSMIETVSKVRRDFGATQVPFFYIKKYNSKLLKRLHELK